MIGTLIYDSQGPAKIIAEAGKYVVARRKRCPPFVLPKRDIGRRWQLQPAREGVDRLRVWCREKVGRQAWLADKTLAHVSMISEVVRGKTIPSKGLALRIEEVTGIPAESLYRRTA